MEINGAWTWHPSSTCFKLGDATLRAHEPLFVHYALRSYSWHDRKPPERALLEEYAKHPSPAGKYRYVGIVHHEQTNVQAPHSTRVVVQICGLVNVQGTPFAVKGGGGKLTTHAKIDKYIFGRTIDETQMWLYPPAESQFEHSKIAT